MDEDIYGESLSYNGHFRKVNVVFETITDNFSSRNWTLWTADNISEATEGGRYSKVALRLNRVLIILNVCNYAQ